jgi:hypothetical protein
MTLRLSPSLLAAALAAACLGAVQAADIYRWTDAQGKVHITDKPPPGHPDAVPLDSKRYEVPAKDRKAAQDRAAQDKKQANQMEQARVRGAQPAASAASGAAKPAAKAAASAPQRVAGESECDRKIREFQKSQECFAPYRTATGGLRPEAQEKCGQGVPDPGPQCAAR